ncbi:glycosyltransferase (activator-dependent family) [Crossiella equi]|uniref:Glycosyltransferase (Activator-dependent family) n=1 Tax=Crossiella equi TaxID=130796 RepID=A0ABS5AA89_9PSEU|nr:activator-dependent family glycosyltransferase [Crossiella equi]MBP2473495.1 glycosyltransferase (activator-dependent family) [Crossiella equi]
MRVLFTAHAERTHLLGMVPLAWEFQNLGHEVRVAVQPSMVDTVTGAGLTAVPVGKDHQLGAVVQASQSLPEEETEPEFDFTRPADELTWDYLTSGYRDNVHWWWRVVNEPMIDDLIAFAQHWRPDLVVWEPLTFAGSLAAAVCGARHARLLWSVDLFGRMRGHYLRHKAQRSAFGREDALARWLTDRLQPHGVRFHEDLVSGQFSIDCIPDSLRADAGLDLPTDHDYLPMRYVPYNGKAVVEPWLRKAPDRPRVCLTLGTSLQAYFDKYAVPVADVLEALADLDVEVVATIAEAEQRKLTSVPANVRLVSFVALNVLAPTCSVVINHAGPGTLFTVARHAVPQLLVPKVFDEPVLARLIPRHGAGLVIPPGEVTADGLTKSVGELLTEPSYRAGAEALAGTLRAMPGPAEVVRAIEARLAADGCTGVA